jgi:hypothetical protein
VARSRRFLRPSRRFHVALLSSPSTIGVGVSVADVGLRRDRVSLDSRTGVDSGSQFRAAANQSAASRPISGGTTWPPSNSL